MRAVREEDIETAYKLTNDICDVASDLLEKGLWDPVHVEIIWELREKNYDICIDVSIIKKENKNG